MHSSDCFSRKILCVVALGGTKQDLQRSEGSIAGSSHGCLPFSWIMRLGSCVLDHVSWIFLDHVDSYESRAQNIFVALSSQ